MAGNPVATIDALEHEYHYCEACGLKVRLHRQECPQCFGPVVRRNARQVRSAEQLRDQQHAHDRATRLPVVIGTAAVVILTGGTWYGLARGTSGPLVADPVVLGRPAPPATAASARSRPFPVAERFDLPEAAVDDHAEADEQTAAHEAALAVHRAELSAHPGNLSAMNNAGQLLVRLKRPKEAVAILERAVALEPNAWMTRFNLARALGETGEWASSAEHYATAAVLMPDHYPTLFNLARAYQKAGNDDAAAEAYARATRADEQQADAWLGLAAASERAGLADQAREAFARYLERAPESPERPKIEQHLARLSTPPATAPEPSVPDAPRP